MSEQSSSRDVPIREMVLVPAVITLGVTLLRLGGELMNWSQLFFTRSAGGGRAIVGIVWLVPVFGVYFAIQLVAAGRGPAHKGRAILITLAALLLIPATGRLTAGLQLGPVAMIMTFGVAWLVALWLAYQAWPALGATLIAYGLAARIPVALVMLVAIFNNWGTHYELGPPNLPPMGPLAKWIVIGLVPQFTLWMGFTASVGGLFGAAAAAVAGRRAAANASQSMSALIAAGTIALGSISPALAAAADFSSSNPFYAPSTLPFQAPPFDRIKDEDFQPALEAGMAQQQAEIQSIANNPEPPTFDNTILAMEKSGRLLTRVTRTFDGVTGANTNPTLQKVETIEAPKLAAHQDFIFLNSKLFARVAAIYKRRARLNLDPESLRLIEYDYDKFVHAGANLSEADKAELRKLNEEESSLSDALISKVLDATKEGAYVTTDKAALAGLSEARIAAAALAAKTRQKEGFVIPLQNATQQPDLLSLSNRATRQTIFEHSWNRSERGDGNDTRDTVARLAQLRAQKARLLGYSSFAAWTLEDQMAKTPQAALQFMDAIVPAATARAASEAKDNQGVIDAQKGGFQLQPWDWNFYAQQVRKARYDLDETQVKPYFEIDNVLQNGLFYAANLLYGLTFKERHDIPVYHPEVRAFEVFDANGQQLALFYCDYFKRDNKTGGAWMSSFVDKSQLLGTLPVVYNVANLIKPAAGEPALISFSDVTTIFQEFGHALRAMFDDIKYPTLSGSATPRDFIEFPSQFNGHWASDPMVFAHYAVHYKTGDPMPEELAARLRKAGTFNKGYDMTELLAAAELDMQWHSLPPPPAPESR